MRPDSPIAERRNAGAAIALSGVSKRYGSVSALADVTLTLAPGQVHALVGQNGAGKSTCLGLIAGRITASEGTVEVGAEPYPRHVDPAWARGRGVVAIHQELSTIPAMTVLDNVFLGATPSRAGAVDHRAMRRRYAAVAERLGSRLDPDARAGTLSIADRQLLEIMRALAFESRVLLLDEPTAALAPPEREALFSVMRELRADGMTLVMVSHYLDEVLGQADTISVFRDGRLIDVRTVDRWDEPALVRTMLGGPLQALADSETPPRRRRRRPLLRVDGLTTSDGVEDVSLEVAAGEIVGLGGLVGSGRSRVMHALAGLGRETRGTLWLDGKQTALPRTPRQAWELGICLVPEDRKRAGLVGAMSSRDNIMIGDLAPCSRAGVIRRGRFANRSAAVADRYGLARGLLDRPARELSGGNQQKLMFARWGNRQPRVLLADEATRGVDVGAKRQILLTLRELADRGLAVVLVSSELEEVATASDRVYVLRAGRVVRHLDRDGELTAGGIVEAAFGLQAAVGV